MTTVSSAKGGGRSVQKILCRRKKIRDPCPPMETWDRMEEVTGLVHPGERMGAESMLTGSTILLLSFPGSLKIFTSFKKHKGQLRKCKCLEKVKTELPLCFGAVLFGTKVTGSSSSSEEK